MSAEHCERCGFLYCDCAEFSRVESVRVRPFTPPSAPSAPSERMAEIARARADLLAGRITSAAARALAARIVREIGEEMEAVRELRTDAEMKR